MSIAKISNFSSQIVSLKRFFDLMFFDTFETIIIIIIIIYCYYYFFHSYQKKDFSKSYLQK